MLQRGCAIAFPAATVPRQHKKTAFQRPVKNQQRMKQKKPAILAGFLACTTMQTVPKICCLPGLLLNQRRQKGCSSRQRSSAKSEWKNRSSPVRQFSAFTAARQGPPSALAADAACRGREGDPGRPKGGRSAKAGADITRPQVGEGSRRRPMRHAADGVQSGSRDKFRVPAQRGVRGCRGESVSFEKGNTLTAAGADVRAQAQGKTAFFPQCAGSAPSDQGAGFSPLTPCPTPGRRPAASAGQKPRCTEGHRLNTSGTSYLFKVEML